MGKNNKKLTNEIFISRSNIIHNFKYDYSKINYINSHTKISIICPIHGEFRQKPYGHLSGYECRKCGNIKIHNKNKETRENFINKSKNIHGDKYDYSNVNYINAHTKISIICPIHGEFEQEPNSHKNGYGCKKCGNVKISENNVKSLKDFINESKNIHGDKYDYSIVEYINTDIKVNIICPKHGLFKQKPTKHLQNQGCPICKESKLEKEIRLLLNYNNIKYIQQYSKKDGGKWLVNQSLDFFIVDYNIAIECQGEQHFNPVDFGNKGVEISEHNFELLKKRDKRKYDLCKRNNISIIYYTNNINYINYKYFDKIFCDSNELLNKIKSIKNGE